MSLQSKLQSTELPRRLLGAMLCLLVPGAGHIVLGYSTLGWAIAAASLTVGAVVVGSAIAVYPTVFLVFGAMYILSTVGSVISVFALPPGPKLKDGLKALWPVLVLALSFRGAAFVVRTYALEAETIGDDALAPQVVPGDVLLIYPGRGNPQPGDLVRFGVMGPSTTPRVRRVASRPDADHVTMQLDPQNVETVPLDQVTGRALFVMATDGKVASGRGRIWQPLTVK